MPEPSQNNNICLECLKEIDEENEDYIHCNKCEQNRLLHVEECLENFINKNENSHCPNCNIEIKITSLKILKEQSEELDNLLLACSLALLLSKNLNNKKQKND